MDSSILGFAGPDKSIAQLPGTPPNLGWASDFFISLAQKNVLNI